MLFTFILIFLPGTAFLLNKLFDFNLNDYYNKQLWGIVENLHKPQINIKNLISHDIQKYYEQLFTNNLPLRTLTIRLSNQIYYSLFKKSYSYNNQIVIGKNKQLYELAYINNYCGLNNPPFDEVYLLNWANILKELNDFFIRKGKKFIYVITPSKAEYLPSDIPNRFHCDKHGISPHVKTLEAFLSERGIHYISGPHLMIQATKEYKTSMFPRGGTHWNYLAGGVAANAIIQTINQLGIPTLKPLTFNYKLKKPEGTDVDLTELLNLFKANKKYLVPKLDFKLSPINSISLAIVGDSFSDQFLDAFLKSDTFSKIDFYRYFKFSKTEYKKNSDPLVEDVNINSAHVLDSILAADVVILEENTLNTMSEHGLLFHNLMKKLALNNKKIDSV